MKNSSEKPKRKLNHPVLGAFGFGVKNLPDGLSYTDEYRHELRQLTGMTKVRASSEENARALEGGEENPKWKEIPEWKLLVELRREFLEILQGNNRLVRNFKDLENRYPDPKNEEESPEKFQADMEFASRLLDNLADHLAKIVAPKDVQDPKMRNMWARWEIPHLSANADDFMVKVLKDLTPGGDKDNLDVTNEVITCSDPAKLILMANDLGITLGRRPSLNLDEQRAKLKARFEALRKAYLMLLYAQVNAYRDERKGDLDFFNGMMRKEVYSPELGFGEHKSHFLVSEHWVREPSGISEDPLDEQSHRCTSWEFYDDQGKAKHDVDEHEKALVHPVAGQQEDMAKSPEDLRMVRIMTPIQMRSFDIEENGEKKTIGFRVHTRFKTPESCLQKLIRKDMSLGEDPSEVVSDLNGVRFVMENEDHIRSFLDKLSSVLGADVRAMVEAMLESKKGKGNISPLKQGRVELSDVQDHAAKNGELPCLKCDIKVDGRPYEFQFFTFPQYADYEYSQPQSHDAYEINRFYESSCSEALFPSEIYGNFDREEYRRTAVAKLLSEHSHRMKSSEFVVLRKRTEEGQLVESEAPVALPKVGPSKLQSEATA